MSGSTWLLHPSARTPSGHRLYDEADVRRLYRIVAMRELGLGLGTIGRLLTGEPDLAELLRDHLDHVDAQLAAIRALRRRLAAMLAVGTDPATPKVQALVRRWMELLEYFHGGDPGLRDSMYRMQAENSAALQQRYGGPSPELIDYVRRANAVAP